MNKIITIAALAIGMFASAQWNNKVINSEFDGRFKKSICKSGNSFLTLEKSENGTPFLALYGSFFCDDTTTIDLVFVINGVNVLHSIEVFKSTDSQYYFFYDSVWTEEFTKDFKNASKCLIRTNQTHCTDDVFTFNMSGSTAALNFIKN